MRPCTLADFLQRLEKDLDGAARSSTVGVAMDVAFLFIFESRKEKKRKVVE